jgi:hypothetical protein
MTWRISCSENCLSLQCSRMKEITPFFDKTLLSHSSKKYITLVAGGGEGGGREGEGSRSHM